jgi:hypothetical protein
VRAGGAAHRDLPELVELGAQRESIEVKLSHHGSPRGRGLASHRLGGRVDSPYRIFWDDTMYNNAEPL